MDLPGFTSPDDKPARSTETVETGAILLAIAHTLTDYMLSDNANITNLASLVGRTDPAEMREEILAAHDAFASMAAHARAELFMTRLLSGDVSMSDLGDDEMPDLPNLDVYGL
jgi:hypothetical protein